MHFLHYIHSLNLQSLRFALHYNDYINMNMNMENEEENINRKTLSTYKYDAMF